MGLIDNILNVIGNQTQNAVGINRDVETLLESKDVSKAISLFQNRDNAVEKAISEYDPETHKIMRRPDKTRKGRPALITAKLSTSYQVLINETELTFLYGNNVKWSLSSGENTKEAYKAFTDFLKTTRFNTTQRQMKRYAGAETESAKLYYLYRAEKGNTKVGVKVLAKSKGDMIRPLFDQYDNMLSFGHGYYLLEGSKTVLHYDIYYPNVIYRCRKANIGWEVTTELNQIGKIPVIYVRQPEAWYGVQPLIDRVELLRSRIADTNDYVADPILMATADVISGMKGTGEKGTGEQSALPEPGSVGKVVQLSGKDSLMQYLTVDTATDLKSNELADLHKVILVMSMTPDLSFEALVSAGAPSGRALRRAMALGYMKRAKNIEIYDIAQDREANLIKSIIGNVLDVSKKSQMDALSVSFEFAEPFQDDVSERIGDIINLYESGLMSLETAVSLIDYVKDPATELPKILAEQAERRQQERESQGSLFGEYQSTPSEDDDNADAV